MPHPEGARLPRLLDRAALLLFVVGVLVAGILYGTVAGVMNWFPTQLLRDAREGAIALRFLWRNGNVPVGFVAYVDEPEPRAQSLAEHPGAVSGWVLVTGGPYEFREECPTFGCLAWLVDRDGNVIHSWETDLEHLWRQADHLEGNSDPGRFYYQGAELLEDGGLLMTFYNMDTVPRGAGLARFDVAGNLVWFSDPAAHHWFTRDPAGAIYTPAMRMVDAPLPVGDSAFSLDCPRGRAEVDFIAVLGPDGRTRKQIDLFGVLIEAGFVELVRRSEKPCDPLHLNFVGHLDAASAAKVDLAEEGDLLISMRSNSTVLLLAPEREEIKWILTGRYINQHSPRLLGDDAMLIFDNRGGARASGGSRIVRQGFDHRVFDVVWPKRTPPAELDPFTAYGGHIDVRPDEQAALVSITDMGEILEIDLGTGEILWRYRKVFPSQDYPGARADRGDHVLTSAFGAYYVDEQRFSAVFAPDGE